MFLTYDNLLDNCDWSIIGEDHISNHKNKEDIKSKPIDKHAEIKNKVKNVTHKRSRGNKTKEVAYSDAETESRTESEAVEFTQKKLQCLDQGKIKRELERDSRSEDSENKRMQILQLGKQ